jgi:hypothetical protein
VLSPKQYEDLITPDADQAGNNVPISEVLQSNAETFQKLITGWKGVCDRSGSGVAFSPEKLAGQITGPRGLALSAGIWQAIREMRFGIADTPGARLGN